MNKNILKFTFLFFYIIVLTGCDYYKPILKPKFKVNNHPVYLDIKKIIEVKYIYVEGYNTRIDDSLDIGLNVQLINPKGLTKNKDSLIIIQKKIASKIKSLLTNPSQFKAYNIFFIRRDTVKGIMGTVITEKGISHHRFNDRDL